MVAQIILWSGLALIFYTFLGYPAVVFAVSRLHRRAITTEKTAALPSVTTVVVAHNEAERIRARVENLLASDYPATRLEALIVSDGSVDGTAGIARSVSDDRVRVLEREESSGKASGLNLAIAEARGDIVVLGDARQLFEPKAVRKFVACFGDPDVGAVCGWLDVVHGADAVSGGVDAHWRLENLIREWEASFDSSIGCTGAMYAIRREAFAPIRDDTILDDVVIPMQIALGGYRVVYEADARGHDPQPFSSDKEKGRKSRTMAGNFQMLFRYPSWLLPWHNRLWWQLISHKYLRLASPVLLLVVLAANIALATHSRFYAVLLACQAVCYLLAVIGMSLPRCRIKLLALPAAFVFVNIHVCQGFIAFLQQRYSRGWKRAA